MQEQDGTNRIWLNLEREALVNNADIIKFIKF